MVFVSNLRGKIRLSSHRYNLLLEIKELGWLSGCNSIGEYLRNSYSYDLRTNTLEFDSVSETYNHQELFGIFAYLKDIESVDTIEQFQETYDSWYKSGKFLIKPGYWSYRENKRLLDIEPISDRDEHFVLTKSLRKSLDTERWNQATPLARNVFMDDESWIVCKMLTGEIVRCGYWHFDLLLKLPREKLQQCQIAQGGSIVKWFDPEQKYRSIQLSTIDILKFAE